MTEGKRTDSFQRIDVRNNKQVGDETNRTKGVAQASTQGNGFSLDNSGRESGRAGDNCVLLSKNFSSSWLSPFSALVIHPPYSNLSIEKPSRGFSVAMTFPGTDILKLATGKATCRGRTTAGAVAGEGTQLKSLRESTMRANGKCRMD